MESSKKMVTHTVTHLSRRILIKNKFKSISIILAVIMTTILFTVLYTISYSMKLSDEKSIMRRIGNTSDVSFKDLTRKQMDKLKQYPAIQQFSTKIFVGVAANDELLGRNTEIWSSLEGEAKMDLAVPTEGKMPVKANEIALDTILLDRLQLPHTLGSTITISWKKNPISEEVLTEQFILSGFWEGDNVASTSKIWVSNDFVQLNFTEAELEKNFKLDITLKNKNKLEEKIETMIIESGYDFNEIQFGTNWSMEDKSITQILFYCLCILLIVICGYLIISNTIRITLQNDIRFYGQLKMLGVTSKQLSQIIFYQITIICCIAVPLGVGIGYFISYLLLPKLLYYYEGGYVLATHPLIFLISAAFAIFTVLISCRKPLHMVAKLPPITSFKGLLKDIKYSKNNKEMKSITLYQLAKRGFSRDKKELILSILSLSLGIILINSIYTIQNSFDVAKYLSDRIVGDFILSPVSLYNGIFDPLDGKELEGISSDIESIEGVKGVSEVYYRETEIQMNETTKKITIDFYSNEDVYEQLSTDENWVDELNNIKNSGKIFTKIYGMDQTALEKLHLYKGELDWDKFQTGNYILECGLADNGDFNDNDKIGDKITVEGKKYTVMAYVDLLALYNRHGSYKETAITKTYIIPSKVFRDIYPEDTLIHLIVDADEDLIQKTEEELNNYQTNVMPKLNIISKSTYLNAYQKEQGASTIMWKTLSFIVVLIGFVNYINIRLTSGFSRKGEFLIMNKSGMTGKQLRVMLNIEGITLIGYTGIISIISSALLSVTFIRAYVSQGWTNTYRFIIIPIIVILLVLFFINYLACWYIFKQIRSNDR